MIRVNVVKQLNYPVNAVKIKKSLAAFFVRRGIVSAAEVSVAIVGEKRMLEIGKKYLKDGKVHNVLSFTPDEAREEFVYPPDGRLHLGEIVICYQKVVAEAKKEGKLIEEKA